MSSVSVLIDTHLLLWILSESKKLKKFTWLKNYSFLTISPISLLEIKFLHECHRIQIDFEEVMTRLLQDERFSVDEVSMTQICLTAFGISWTRDPFDRLLVAHSMVKKIPLGTCDSLIQQNYAFVQK